MPPEKGSGSEASAALSGVSNGEYDGTKIGDYLVKKKLRLSSLLRTATKEHKSSELDY